MPLPEETRSHEEWLSYLASKLDVQAPRARQLRRYTNGDEPLAEMNAQVKEAWAEFQKRSRGGFGYLVVSALAERMVPVGVTVDGEAATRSDRATPDVMPEESPETQADLEAAKKAAEVWDDTMFGVRIADVLMEMFTVSVGYMLVEEDGDGPVVSVEKAEGFYAHPDRLRPWVTDAAIQTWRDTKKEKDYARVWANGSRIDYERTVKNERTLQIHRKVDSNDWKIVPNTEQTYEGRPPVFIFENREGFGEFERQTDTIDRINYDVLSRLSTQAAQLFKQRAIKGKLDEKDEDDNDIDWSAAFPMHPGAVWNVPEDVDIWESTVGEITGYISSENQDLKMLSSLTQTPLASLVPDGANQTAEGAAFQKESVVTKANDRIKRVSPVFGKVMVLLLEVSGIEVPGKVEIQWEPTDRVSLAEKYDAAVKAKSAGESWPSIARNILGYTPEQIKQDMIDRANEQLTMQLMMPPVQDNEADDSGDNLRASNGPVQSNGGA